jgi:hypothetical protein
MTGPKSLLSVDFLPLRVPNISKKNPDKRSHQGKEPDKGADFSI